MILARDLGYRLEGTDSDDWKSKNIRGVSLICVSLMKWGILYGPYCCGSHSGAFTGFCLILMAQDQERIEGQTTATNRQH